MMGSEKGGNVDLVWVSRMTMNKKTMGSAIPLSISILRASFLRALGDHRFCNVKCLNCILDCTVLRRQKLWSGKLNTPPRALRQIR